MHVCLIGNVGSGKSTLAEQLAESLNMPLVSSAQIAYELASGDPTTRLALKQGAMAPEHSMRSAIKAALEAAEIQHGGWILDGFPRSIEQLVCLMQWSSALPVFVYLELDSWTCMERMVMRARDDDNPDAIARRLHYFETHVQPMLSVLEDGGVLHSLDGRLPPSDTRDQVIQLIS